MTELTEAIEALGAFLTSGILLIGLGFAMNDLIDIDLVVIGFVFIIVTVLLGIALIVAGTSQIADEL